MPFVIALFFLLVFSAASIYLRELENLRILVREDIDSVKKLFENQVRHNAELLGGIIDFLLEEEENLRGAWLIKDRTALFNQTFPLFNAMRSQYNVTHFYFIDLQGVCFLRVHDPANFGDTINRFTLKQAMSTGSSTYGVEVGPLGILTLRRVYPWYFNNKLEGYIELGKEIHHITPELKKILGVELIFTIDKSLLDREKWERGLRTMGRTGNWEDFRDFVIADNTVEDGTIPEINAYLKRFHRKHSRTIFKVTTGNQVYCGEFVPLIDASGSDIGDLVILKDVTKYEKSLLHLFAALVFASVTVCGIFFFYFSRIKNSLIKANEG